MLSKELKEQIEKEIKFWAKNNMCASCYCDLEIFIDVMQDIIDGYDNNDIIQDIIQDCINELKYVNIEVTDEVVEYIKQLIQKEAKYWLKDYYKHKKDYELEYEY